MKTGIRLLLLEFLSVERARSENSECFPFYSGAARAQGGAVEWLAYGCDFSVDPRRGNYVDLSPCDRASLRRAVRGFRPTCILSSERLSAQVLAVLRAQAPQACFATTPDLTEGRGSESLPERARDRGVDELGRLQGGRLPFSWLEAPAGRRRRLEDILPDYRARVMNRRGREIRGFVRIVGGRACTSTVPLGRNPFFRGVDLRPYAPAVGCGFCVTPRGGGPGGGLGGDPVRGALRQLRQAAGAGGRNSGEYYVDDARVFLRLESFFGALLRLRFPPGAFYFSPRIDDFLSQWRALNRLLPRLAAAGHTLHILYMGVENFSPPEQARFNKGIRAAQAAEGFLKVKDLRRRFPETFFMQGFGFILFTPWTTLADLRRNLAVARAIGYPVCGHMLSSVLRFDRGSPLSHAARRDGLWAARAPDPGMAYDTWRCRSWQEGQTFFRFRDPAVARLFRAQVRVVACLDAARCGDYFGKDDPEARKAAAFCRVLPGVRYDYLGIAELLLEAGRGLAPRVGASGLLDRAARLAVSSAWRTRLEGNPKVFWPDRPIAGSGPFTARRERPGTLSRCAGASRSPGRGRDR